MKKHLLTAAIVTTAAVLTTGCINTPTDVGPPVHQHANESVSDSVPETSRYRDITQDEQDLNDEAFDLAWEKVLGYDWELQSQACQAFRYDPEAAWQAFDLGSRHIFTRDVFTRGVNRHCL